MHTFVEKFTGLTWEEYVASPQVDTFIQGLIRGMGVFYLLAGIVVCLPVQWMKRLAFLLPVASVLLFLLAGLYWKEKFFYLAELFEYTAQCTLPLLLYQMLFSHNPQRLAFFICLAVAITFTAHGLYAVGYYPVPGNFVDMVVVNFGFTEAAAFRFLFIVGILDFVIAALIFFPKVSQPVLVYAFAWGLATAVARVWAGFSPTLPLETLHQWGWEVLFRIPHAGLPLATLFLVHGHLKKKTGKPTPRPAYV